MTALICEHDRLDEAVKIEGLQSPDDVFVGKLPKNKLIKTTGGNKKQKTQGRTRSFLFWVKVAAEFFLVVTGRPSRADAFASLIENKNCSS